MDSYLNYIYHCTNVQEPTGSPCSSAHYTQMGYSSRCTLKRSKDVLLAPQAQKGSDFAMAVLSVSSVSSVKLL